MEHLLLKMARQLDGLDEASLLSLWEKYAATVSRFEPTKRWEEAALVLSLIQAKHWKNQLFNHNWAARSRPGATPMTDAPLFTLETQPTDSSDSPTTRKRASVLAFRRKENPSAPQGATDCEAVAPETSAPEITPTAEPQTQAEPQIQTDLENNKD